MKIIYDNTYLTQWRKKSFIKCGHLQCFSINPKSSRNAYMRYDQKL